MSWRVVVVSSRAKLDYKMDYLVVRNENETRRVHLSEISVLMIESTAVSVTSYLLCELIKRKINVVFCDEKRLPFSSLNALNGSHDTSMKLRSQVKWEADIKGEVWSEIIRAKINGQKVVLALAGKVREVELLETYLSEIQAYDSTNREGHAAKVYFNSLFGSSFSRSSECNINSALNYGYSILLSCFAREIVSCGYCTQLGLFHDNMFNHYNLASDLMEPFRIYIDKKVYEMDLSAFEHSEKMQIVNILNSEVLIEGRYQYMMNAIKIYTKSVFEAINEKDVSLMRIPAYEL